MRTVIVRHIDKVISEYNDQEIINNIEATNGWAKVEFVYKLTDNGRMLKIRFNTTEMAARAVRDGLVVVYQRIPPRYIEKIFFVKLTPCYRLIATAMITKPNLAKLTNSQSAPSALKKAIPKITVQNQLQNASTVKASIKP